MSAVTFIPLIKAQSRSLALPVKDNGPSQEDQKTRRARLGFGPTPRKAAPLPEIVPEPVFVPVEAEKEPEGYVPLNMLAPPSWKFLLAYCCIKHGMSQKAVLSGRRNVQIVNCRYEAMALIHTHQKKSTPEIGKMFNRDHTAVLHALRKVGAKKLPVDFPLNHKSRPAKREPVDKNGMTRRQYWNSNASGRTALQQAIKRGYESGVSALDIAEAYGCNVKSVHVIAHRLGLSHPNYRFWNVGEEK